MGANMPFFIFDVYNFQLITTGTIPDGNIRDVKQVYITETPIPGRNFQPISPGGNGNRKVSFTLPLVRRTTGLGNIAILKQFERLRNQSSGIAGLPGLITGLQQFAPNPKVLFNWGTGSVPLIYYVTKCDFSHMAGMVNAQGMPQYTMIDMELTLDEDSIMYRSEEWWRTAVSLMGNVEGVRDTEQRTGGNLF